MAWNFSSLSMPYTTIGAHRGATEAGEVDGHELAVIGTHHELLAGDRMHRATNFGPTGCARWPGRRRDGRW